MDELTQQQQGMPVASTPTVPPANAVAGQQPAPAQAAMGATSPAGSDLDALRKKLEQYERDVRQIKSQADKRAFELEQQALRERAELQAQLYQAQTAGMSEDDKARAELEWYKQNYQQMAGYVQQMQAMTAAERHKAETINMYRSYGVPDDVLLAEDSQASPQAMQKIALDYLAKRPPPQAVQPQAAPQMQYAPQQQYAPIQQPMMAQNAPSPPPMTMHAGSAMNAPWEQKLRDLRDRTAKDKEDTVLEGLQAIRERQRAGGGL